MLEYPEVKTVSAQLNEHAVGRRIARVLPPSKAHKFCWFAGDPAEYNAALAGSCIKSAESFGIFAELSFDSGLKLCFNDGVNARLVSADAKPKAYQLMIELEDGGALAFTVAMYGGIILHGGGYDNEYYLKSRAAVDPLSDEFEAYYRALLDSSAPNLSAKAFLATEQRFPGIGNGVLQDILFRAKTHPKRKLATLSAADADALLRSAVDTLREMTRLGGRDTEKDIFGAPGRYRTLMSKNSLAAGCPVCGGPITKESYLGGSVYYCARCQPLE